MNADQKSSTREKLLWPLAAVTIAALLSINPFYAPHIPFQIGVTIWFLNTVLAIILPTTPATTRIAILVTGISFTVPCFLWASPLARALLMCGMGLPFAIATAPLFAPPTADTRGRLAYFFSWMGKQTIRSRPRSFDAPSFLRLAAATLLFAAALAGVKNISPVGSGLLFRWLAGGITILAFAEIATASHDFLTALMGLTSPALMNSPHLSTSITEFWTKRWNVAASTLVFRPILFTPLARQSAAFALFTAFSASAVGHILLVYMAMLQWKISLICGAFFLVQPFLILAERQLNVHRWPKTAARIWTLAALTISSPLFVEPQMELIAPNLNATNSLLIPTMLVCGFAFAVNAFFLLGQLAFCPKLAPPHTTSSPITRQALD